MAISPKSAAVLKLHGRRQGNPWGQERRLEFIDYRLQWDGRLNRSDLIEQFGISVPQASTDISSYAALAPENLTYDRSERVYVAAPSFAPVFPSSSVERYLADLAEEAGGGRPVETNFLGWTPPLAFVSTPRRQVPSGALVAAVRAIREQFTLRILYQSMARPEPNWREVAPHGLGFDGVRWHMRAFCHERQTYRDFVFARVLDVKAGEPSVARGEEDQAWMTPTRLVLVPRPGLSKSKQRVVELDFGMVRGEVVLEAREAMLFYLVNRLGLFHDGKLLPQGPLVAIKNVDDVRRTLQRLADRYE
jgi:hypothetical protein